MRGGRGHHFSCGAGFPDHAASARGGRAGAIHGGAGTGQPADWPAWVALGLGCQDLVWGLAFWAFGGLCGVQRLRLRYDMATLARLRALGVQAPGQS